MHRNIVIGAEVSIKFIRLSENIDSKDIIRQECNG